MKRFFGDLSQLFLTALLPKNKNSLAQIRDGMQIAVIIILKISVEG
jgi:hypothetical protein